MEYSRQLVCFIDMLGFSEKIGKSVDQRDTQKAIYRAVHSLMPKKIREALYADIPIKYKNGTKKIVEISENEILDSLLDYVESDYPIHITQFSDSFVISCPADNPVSCYLLTKCISSIYLLFFYNTKILMRGGISIGELIHEETGALFGPAMIEAYELESKRAIYPRIVISEEAYAHLFKNINLKIKYDTEADNPLNIINKSFDGHWFIDLITIMDYLPFDNEKHTNIAKYLNEIEFDILKNSPKAHPKIAYLLDRWKRMEDRRLV